VFVSLGLGAGMGKRHPRQSIGPREVRKNQFNVIHIFIFDTSEKHWVGSSLASESEPVLATNPGRASFCREWAFVVNELLL